MKVPANYICGHPAILGRKRRKNSVWALKTRWPARSCAPANLFLLDEQSLKKIKTDYLVYSLVYVPLKAHDRVVGVLGVDNRNQKKAFTDYHVRLLSAVADFAGIAIENARLFSGTNDELNRLGNHSDQGSRWCHYSGYGK